MKSAFTLVAVLCLAYAANAAPTSSGYLVDAKCYDISEQNVNPGDENIQSDRDKDLEIRLCAPNAKTKSFGLVQDDWEMFRLDAGGNAKASEFVRNAAKQKEYRVTVSGEVDRKALKTDSISLTK